MMQKCMMLMCVTLVSVMASCGCVNPERAVRHAVLDAQDEIVADAIKGGPLTRAALDARRPAPWYMQAGAFVRTHWDTLVAIAAVLGWGGRETHRAVKARQHEPDM